MDCCVFSDGDTGSWDFYDEVTRTARKPHRCYECDETIPVGAKYEHAGGKWEGDIVSYKTCLSCVEIRNHFAKACGGHYLFGVLWESLEDNFFPDMRAGGPCMEGLSPAAKARLFEKRLKWLEEAAS